MSGPSKPRCGVGEDALVRCLRSARSSFTGLEANAQDTFFQGACQMSVRCWQRRLPSPWGWPPSTETSGIFWLFALENVCIDFPLVRWQSQEAHKF